MARNRRSSNRVGGKNNHQAAGQHRWLEPLEERVLFSQPPLTVQPPAAFVVSAPDVTSAGGASIDITVQYTDSTPFNFTTFNQNNLTVTGPGNATLAPVSETQNAGGSTRYPQFTYTFAAPNGAWDSTADGTYTISTTSNSANAVSDSGTNPVTVGAIGHFKVFTDGTQATFTGGAVSGNFTANGVMDQSDGSYVLVGTTPIGSGSNTGLVVQRYGGSGGADYTFGADGEADIQFGAGSAGYASVEQNDGQLVVAGTTTDPSTSATDFTVFRIGGSGFPDPTFGQDLNGDGTPDGLETIDVGGSNPAAYGVALQIDGGIVAVGTTNDLGSGDFAIARVNPSTGLLDTGFGTNGFTTTSFGSAASAGAVVIEPSNNDILVAGKAGSNVVLAAYTPDGILDTTFGSGGTVTVPGLLTNSFHVGLALQSNGQILVGSTDSNGGLAVERLDTDGTVDTAFGTNGIASIAVANASARASSIVVQSGGQIDVGGLATTAGGSESVVATLTANGQPDNQFSGADYTVFNAGSVTAPSVAMSAAPGGVVVASSNTSPGTTQFAQVSTGSNAPTASLTTTTVNSPAASASFTITYSDPIAINPATVGTGNITVSDGSESLTVTSATPASQSPGSPMAVTYTVAAPNGLFSAADNGTYTVALASQVANSAGTPVAANASLGTITINEASAPAPVATLTAASLTTNNSPTYSFSVTYADALGINVATVGTGNVTVTGPNGALVVRSAVVDTNSNGTPRTVTYTVAAPHDVFSTADNGSYTIALTNTLKDVNGTPTTPNASFGTFTVSVTNPARTALGTFGIVAGSKKPEKLTVSVNGVPTLFTVTNGTGQAFLNGIDVDLTITATSGKKAAVSVKPKGGRITLGDVTITGNVSTFTAPTSDLSGTFYIAGIASTVTVGNVSNSTFGASGALGTLKAISLTNSNVLDGVSAGADGTLGTSDDTYGAGIINTVTIAGPISASVVAAGANPVNGVFGDGNDTLAGAGSMIKSITAKGGTTGATVIESGAIKSASLPKKIKTLSTDSRFKILG